VRNTHPGTGANCEPDGELLEMRVSDLQFTPAETDTYLTQPPMALAMGALFLGESATPHALAGVGLVIAASILAARAEPNLERKEDNARDNHPPHDERGATNASGEVDSITYDEVQTPKPGTGEVLVEVHAAAIARNELTWSADRLPAIPSMSSPAPLWRWETESQSSSPTRTCTV